MSQQEKDARSDRITAEITAWLANNEKKAQEEKNSALINGMKVKNENH